MGIINTQAVANAKKVLTGKNGALYNAKGKLLAQSELFAEPQGETYAVTWRGKSLELDGRLSENHRMRYRVTDGAGHVFFYEGDASDGSMQLMEDPPQE